MTEAEAVWTGLVIFALIVGFTLGWLRGNKACNDWWNQYGAQIFAERGAVIYGTALYKQPSPAPSKDDAPK